MAFIDTIPATDAYRRGVINMKQFVTKVLSGLARRRRPRLGHVLARVMHGSPSVTTTKRH